MCRYPATADQWQPDSLSPFVAEREAWLPRGRITGDIQCIFCIRAEKQDLISGSAARGQQNREKEKT